MSVFTYVFPDPFAHREGEDGRIKRRKVGFFTELTRSSARGENLLEKLREATISYGPETNEEFQQWADLVDRISNKT